MRKIYLKQNEDIESVFENVGIFLADSVYDYPRHIEWYDGVMQEIQTGCNRKMFIVYDNKTIIGVSIIKKNQLEKKICSLRVAKEYRGNGIGTSLFKKSLEYLETDKPILTVSENKKEEFQGIFDYFGFSLEQIYHDKYMRNRDEYCYNGILLPEDILLQKNINSAPKSHLG